MECATKEEWNPITTEDILDDDLGGDNDPIDVVVIIYDYVFIF